MAQHMSIELALGRKAFLAVLALERLVSGVRYLVILEMRAFFKCLAANFATEWRLLKYTGYVIVFALKVPKASFALCTLIRDWTARKLDYMTPVCVPFPSLNDWFLCYLKRGKCSKIN